MKKANLFAIIINITTLVLFLSVLYLEIYNIIFGIFFLITPWLAFYLASESDGLIKLTSPIGKQIIYSSIVFSILIPCVGLFLIPIGMPGIIEDYSMIWLPVSFFLIITGISCFYLCRKPYLLADNRTAITVLLTVFIVAYAFSATIFINKAFDTSVLSTSKEEIQYEYWTDSHSSSNARLSNNEVNYYLQISSWQKGQDSINIEVSHSFYTTVSIGDSVQVVFKKGFFGIPWYKINGQ